MNNLKNEYVIVHEVYLSKTEYKVFGTIADQMGKDRYYIKLLQGPNKDQIILRNLQYFTVIYNINKQIVKLLYDC